MTPIFWHIDRKKAHFSFCRAPLDQINGHCTFISRYQTHMDYSGFLRISTQANMDEDIYGFSRRYWPNAQAIKNLRCHYLSEILHANSPARASVLFTHSCSLMYIVQFAPRCVFSAFACPCSLIDCAGDFIKSSQNNSHL